jgi:hypothetical protein
MKHDSIPQVPQSRSSNFSKICKFLAFSSLFCIFAAAALAMTKGPGLLVEIFSVLAISTLFLLLFFLLGVIPYVVISGYWEDRRNRRKWPAAEIEIPEWGKLRREAGFDFWACDRQNVRIHFHDDEGKLSPVEMAALGKVWQDLQGFKDKAIQHLASTHELPAEDFEVSILSMDRDGTIVLGCNHSSDDYGTWEVLFRDGEVTESVYGD